jgi:hypothetical protein
MSSISADKRIKSSLKNEKNEIDISKMTSSQKKRVRFEEIPQSF